MGCQARQSLSLLYRVMPKEAASPSWRTKQATQYEPGLESAGGCISNSYMYMNTHLHTYIIAYRHVQINMCVYTDISMHKGIRTHTHTSFFYFGHGASARDKSGPVNYGQNSFYTA